MINSRRHDLPGLSDAHPAMKIYTLSMPGQADLEYRDRKRHAWLLAYLVPLLGIIAIVVHLILQQQWVLWMPVLFSYGLVPILDMLIREDTRNPPEAIIGQLEQDRYYRRVSHGLIPIFYASIILTVWLVANGTLDWHAILAVSMTAGFTSGLAVNLGHELGHKKSRLDQWMARCCLAVPAYGHFTIEHNAGHHAQVATPEDSASARYGESLYRFALRELPGGFLRALRLERARLSRQGRGFFSGHNQILQSWAITLVLYSILIGLFGVAALVVLCIHTPFAWWQLTCANYVEHYGLLRQKREDGRYERCKPHHSWNSNHLFSNLLLLHLQRHSDHHAWPARHYQSLRHFEEAPQLPNGYFGMFVLAYVPALWRRVMDPKVLEQARGDFSRINTGPAS